MANIPALPSQNRAVASLAYFVHGQLQDCYHYGRIALIHQDIIRKLHLVDNRVATISYWEGFYPLGLLQCAEMCIHFNIYHF